MKKIIILSIALASSSLAFAQKSCCAKPESTEAFAMLTHDKKFVATHLDPTPFTLSNPIGQNISFKTPDGKEGYAYEIKATTPTNNYIFVIHEWWGLNDYIKQESEKLFSTLGNVNVIAIDLYDKKVAAVKDSAAKYMQSVKSERAEAIIKGVLSHVGNKANIATIGWCFGGGWSLQTSIEGGKQAVGCMMYYGQPEKDVNRLKTINCDIVGFFGNLDQWPSPAVVDQFVKDAAAAGVKLSVNRYEANHAFANPSNPNHNQAATDDAYAKVLAFVKARMN